MSPSDLARLLGGLPVVHDENVIVSESTVDDAGVYLLEGGQCLVQTVDIFPPVIQDPFLYGQIVAANSLSDVWAMGGRPITAMNLIGFPTGKLPLEILSEILRGGAEKVREAGAVLLGGHTWRDSEIKYGMSVTGLVDRDRIIANANARPGDRLILTKPIGTGVITTAIRGGLVPPELQKLVSLSMARLNMYACDVMLQAGVMAATDVTGFGLFGHAVNIARGSKVSLRFFMDSIPLFEGAEKLCAEGFLPAGSMNNREWLKDDVAIDPSIPAVKSDLLFDAQTSGGLLICVPDDQAAWLLRAVRDAGDVDAADVGEVLPHQGVSILLAP